MWWRLIKTIRKDAVVRNACVGVLYLLLCVFFVFGAGELVSVIEGSRLYWPIRILTYVVAFGLGLWINVRYRVGLKWLVTGERPDKKE